MMSPILSLKNITYQYPDGTIALNDISLSLDPGKKIALIGNNGAGKSTLFLLLNGILKPTSGNLIFNGEKLTYKRKEIKLLRKLVGIVFQNPETQLFSSSIYEDIKFGPKNLGLSQLELEKVVQDAMVLTETEALKDKPPHFLSIGQKKRVAIAGIIAMNPRLMILDEPTAGLDPYYSKKIMSLLEDIHNKNRTIILSTHNVDLAYEWADEIIVLHDGKIIEQGAPCEVFQNEAAIKLSHLEKPWVIEVFEKLQDGLGPQNQQYPKSKQELFKMLKTQKTLC
ncbi:energy-coupling factor ABC transporter ATP-binding protein [Bacillus marasmi]|uniref:energy-coupling factor ABC transporter ATP-binding protein n=1 Tax=Bacillus marasmi TaxID=1926279 RepID=UPI0011C90066|nr:ATP-binding cassette domain-containing protein [Bacillus marasmi]